MVLISTLSEHPEEVASYQTSVFIIRTYLSGISIFLVFRACQKSSWNLGDILFHKNHQVWTEYLGKSFLGSFSNLFVRPERFI